MGETIIFVLVYFIGQVVLLVLCMHIAGRKLGLDFGPFWPAIGKAAVVLLIGSIVIGPLAGMMGLHFGLLFLVSGYALAFKFAFGFDYWEALTFTGIYFITIIILHFVLVMFLLNRLSS